MASFFCFIVVACSQNLYIPTAATIKDIDRLAALTEGRKLYIAKCSSCHNLYKPETYSAEKWTNELNEMKEKAMISDYQAGLILKYLTGYKSETEGKGEY